MSASTDNALEGMIRLMNWPLGKGSGSSSLSAETKAAAAFLASRQGPITVFDVGANRGMWSRALKARLNGRPVSWHLFEPQASLHQQLEQVCASLGSARLNRTAVSDSEGEMQLYSDDEGSGMASLAHRNLSHVGLTMRPLQKVQTITLDSYCEQQNIGTVDFLKLDVEGYELAVLRGATGLLHSRRVAALQFEFGGCNVDTRTFFRDFWELLTSRGYQLHRVTPFGLRRISKYREADEYFLTTNYFARLEQI